MDSAQGQINVPLRGAGKKMKKRKELDALVAHSAVAKRGGGNQGGGVKRGVSSKDQLLSDSTEGGGADQDDFWGLRLRGEGCGGRKTALRRRTCGSLLRACVAVLVFVCAVATTTVMWLFIDVREQVTLLRTELDTVVAGSQGVPDALQKCHSLSRELQQNQTELFSKIASLTQQLGNYDSQLIVVQSSLQGVEDQLKAAPELVNVPRDLQALSNSVASFGSQIRDLDNSVTAIKDQSARLEEASKTFSLNITSLKSAVDKLLNTSQEPRPVSNTDTAEKEALTLWMNQMSSNVSLVNDTLSKKLQWVLEDQLKDHKLIEMLREGDQNVSARLTTLEGDCAKSSVQNVIQTNVSQLADLLNKSESRWRELSPQVSQLKTQYKQLEVNETRLLAALQDIRQRVDPVLTPSQTISSEEPQPFSEKQRSSKPSTAQP